MIISIKASSISFLSGNCPDLIISIESNLSGKLVNSFSGIKDKGSLKALISFFKLFTELSISEDTVVAD